VPASVPTRYLLLSSTLSFDIFTQRPPSAYLSRRLPTPNRLQEPIALRQPVQAVVALGATAHEAAERVNLVLPGVAACLIDFADANLDRGVVFRFDDAVRGGAFARDVAVAEDERLAGW
jgi:hypothetical protein